MWYVFLENLFFIVVDFSCFYYLNLYIYIFFFNLVPCPIGFEFSIHQRLGAMCKPCPANMTTEKMGSTKPCMKCPPNSMTNQLTICQCERFIIVLSQTYNFFMNFVFFFIVCYFDDKHTKVFILAFSYKQFIYLQQPCWCASYKCSADLHPCGLLVWI